MITGSVVNILQKVIVARFYERNAGLFFFIFFLMFGIVESNQLVNYHFSLMTGMVTSPIFMAIVCLIWVVYMLRCFQFILNALSLPKNEFLFRIGLLNKKDQFVSLFLALVIVYLPVLIYSTFVVGVAIRAGRPGPAMFVPSFHLTLLAIVSLLTQKKIISSHVFHHTFSLPHVQWRVPRRFLFFYLGQLTAQLKTILWVTKAFSAIALVGFFKIAEGSDIRAPLLGFLFGIAAHSVMVFELRRFEDQYLVFSKNLPLTLLKRFGTVAAVYAVVLLPEFVLLLVNKIQIAGALGGLSFGAGILTLLHCLLYAKTLNMDRHLQTVLFIFLVSFLLVLSQLYLVETALCWFLAWIIFAKNFEGFEGTKG